MFVNWKFLKVESLFIRVVERFMCGCEKVLGWVNLGVVKINWERVGIWCFEERFWYIERIDL